MLNKKIAAMAALAVALFAAGPVAAAQSTVSLNVRSGPGTGYGVVDVLYAGENVDVQECATNGWCRITHSGPDGWVSRSYLTNTGSTPQRPPARPSPSRPDVNFAFDIPGFSFSIGNGGRFGPRPGGYHRGGQVCFYEDVNYRGASFCARPGQAAANIGGTWNDRISSIRVIGGAEVQVCEDVNFGGRCAVVDRSRPSMGGRNNDLISSYRVR